MINGSCLGFLNVGDFSYLWFVDFWLVISLLVNNSNSGLNDIGNFGCGDVLLLVLG